MILKTELHRENLIKIIKELDLKTPYIVKWNKYFPKRTISQNSYYWLLLTCLEVDSGAGCSKNDFHETFLVKFAPKKEIEIEDFMLLPKRTTEMTTKEFTNYIEEIIQFSLHFFGIVLPRPEDLEFERFKEYYSNYIN